MKTIRESVIRASRLIEDGPTRRKNKVVVEYTSSKPLSAHEARSQVDELLRCGLARARDQPRWWRFGAVKIVTKEFDRVYNAIRRREGW